MTPRQQQQQRIDDLIEHGAVIPAGVEAWISRWGKPGIERVVKCANEEYDRNASPSDRGQPRFISCPCPKCSV